MARRLHGAVPPGWAFLQALRRCPTPAPAAVRQRRGAPGARPAGGPAPRRLMRGGHRRRAARLLPDAAQHGAHPVGDFGAGHLVPGAWLFFLLGYFGVVSLPCCACVACSQPPGRCPRWRSVQAPRAAACPPLALPSHSRCCRTRPSCGPSTPAATRTACASLACPAWVPSQPFATTSESGVSFQACAGGVPPRLPGPHATRWAC